MLERGDGSFSLGNNVWPGAGKVIEETGELGQVFGKLIATRGSTTYWGDLDLREKFIEEIGDTLAALAVFVELNFTEAEQNQIFDRADTKADLFMSWYEQDIG